jgi:D-hexose-6-phosphate mutarotase
LICGLPYPLFGSKKKDESNSQRGLQKNDDWFAIRRMNEKDMLAVIQQNKEKKEAAIFTLVMKN